jgi:hypothetical protein
MNKILILLIIAAFVVTGHALADIGAPQIPDRIFPVFFI